MSSKAVDVTAKPTLREQYFTDRSGIALALALARSVSACYVSSCLDLGRFVGWRARNEERACSLAKIHKGRKEEEEEK